MREARNEGEERDEDDVQGGGYEGVAGAIMAAISRGEPASLILNVRNGTAVPGCLPTPSSRCRARSTPRARCRAGEPARGAPARSGAAGQGGGAAGHRGRDHGVGAARRRGLRPAPLVDSVTVARELLRGYRARIPLVDAVFRA